MLKLITNETATNHRSLIADLLGNAEEAHIAVAFFKPSGFNLIKPYMDDHINDVIKKSLPTIKSIIHINPGMKFEFEHPNITEINPLEEKLNF
jgi:HKD family nuclease